MLNKPSSQSPQKQKLEVMSEQDQGLYYPVLLVRQFARMINSLALMLLLCAALIAETDQLAQSWFGEYWQLVSLIFVVVMAVSIKRIFPLLEDFIDEVKSGKRLHNCYTLIRSVSLVTATLTLFQWQARQFKGGDALSIFELLWQAIF